MDRAESIKLHWQHAWQPFTQMKLAFEPYIIEKAEGMYLYAKSGEKIMDCVGSWWVNIHGHNHPEINRAVSEQLEQFEHVMYAGFTHQPAIELGKKLSDYSEGKLPYTFYSDNGSTAVEIGLKMAFQYFVNTGRPEKCEFASLQRGYHGDTIGTMSVGTRSVFHKVYESLLFDVHQAREPAGIELDEDSEDAIARLEPSLNDLARLLEEKGSRICGLILEPLIQGAGGMNIYHPAYLREVRDLCNRYDVFLIADEVFTGCGRLGAFFACQKAGIYPDIMALSKGLSAGYFPFAATLASQKIYDGFYSDDRMHTLFHGHSMTANPPGCVASLKSLELYERNNCAERIADIEKQHTEHLRRLKKGPIGHRIRSLRCMGSVAAVEFDLQSGYTGEFAPSMLHGSIRRGALLRPLGDVVYMTPPYIITDDELAFACDVLEKTATEVLER